MFECCTDCTGELIINPGGDDEGFMETSLHTPAWCALDLATLWAGAETRGGNVTVPGAIGTRAQRRRIDETEYTIYMGINGKRDKDGVYVSDPLTQLYTNIAYLRENVVDPPTDLSPTRSAELTLPDGSTTLNAEIQVTGFQLGNRVGPLAVAVLKIMIPLGRFT